MSDTETPTTETEHDDQTPEVEQTAEETLRVNKEARYRVERNEARAERDALAQRVERMQRADIERLAGEHLSMPADLFSLSGNAVTDYLTEDGEVDADKVAADVAAILAERPGLKKGPVRGFDPTQGTGGRESAMPEPATWADLLKT